MKKALLIVGLVFGAVAADSSREESLRAQALVTRSDALSSDQALVDKYCVGCHNDRNKDRTSGLSFQAFDAATITDHADVGERMIRRLRSGMSATVEIDTGRRGRLARLLGSSAVAQDPDE